MLRPASWKIRSSTFGTVRMVGAHVEAESALVQHRRFAAEPIVLVVESDRVAARRADAGRREAAQPCADHGDRRPDPHVHRHSLGPADAMPHG